MKPEQDRFWEQDVMPIGGYYGPIASYEDKELGYISEDFLQDKYFELIAECGLNIIVSTDSDYDSEPEDVHKTLKLCEKHQLRLCVRDRDLHSQMTDSELEKRMSEYNQSSAFAGVRVVDEPSTTYFPRNLDGKQLLQNNPLSRFQGLAVQLNGYKGIFGYVNLLPFYYWMGNSVEEYKNYVNECCDACQAKVLSYDHYPFDFAERDKALSVYFMNLSIIRGAAISRKIPFWAFVQCGGQWNDRKQRFESRSYYPTEGEFTWNVNTCLAFGAKGIQYFPLVQPHWFGLTPDGFDPRRQGMIGLDGRTNPWYDYAKKVNRQIAAVDEFLMNANSQGILVFGKAQEYMQDVDCLIQNGTYRELTDVKTQDAGAIIGCFDYKGQTALYIVNHDMKRGQDITLQFEKTHKLRFVSEKGCIVISERQSALFLGAGEAMLLIVE